MLSVIMTKGALLHILCWLAGIPSSSSGFHPPVHLFSAFTHPQFFAWLKAVGVFKVEATWKK